jgi:NADH-quinone oxidoreductase subunit L
MFRALGVGAPIAAIFHLATHAFFKALLFLGSGSVIHAMGGEQDMRKMGGLRTKMPWTFWTFALASIAIAGIPPFAGFFSKDEILWRTWDTHAFPNGWGKVLWLMGAAAAAGTAFYMTRLVVMTFLGQKHEAHDDAGHGHHEPHESPWSMRIALVLLATGSVFTGFLGVPPALKGGDEFGAWLVPVVGGGAHGPAHAIEYILMLASVLLAVGGVALAFHVYGVRKGVPAREFAEKNKELYELVRDKYRVDEFYDKAVIGPLLDLNEGTCRFDNEVVDGMVNGSAWVGRTVARGAGIADNEVVDAGVNAAAEATQVLGGKIRRIQTGNIKQYLTFALVGGLFVIAFFCVVLTWDRITQIFM